MTRDQTADQITANTIAERVNMLAAMGRDNETGDLRKQYADLMTKIAREK